ncbi:hypothetical protein tb265_39370 [Gemmatimonadetes bacterium T265]|nr:hypothetical protein tb265_39370 [Gemmatimonadetes bacterium T265]
MSAPQLLAMGRGTAERYQPGAREICISIRSPGESVADLSPRFMAVLHLAFADACFPYSAEVARRTISARQAEDVAAFVALYRDRARRIVVHCAVGASRSVSLALALSYAHGWSVPRARMTRGQLVVDAGLVTDRFPHRRFIPNRSVFVRVARACRPRTRNRTATGVPDAETAVRPGVSAPDVTTAIPTTYEAPE